MGICNSKHIINDIKINYTRSEIILQYYLKTRDIYKNNDYRIIKSTDKINLIYYKYELIFCILDKYHILKYNTFRCILNPKIEVFYPYSIIYLNNKNNKIIHSYPPALYYYYNIDTKTEFKYYNKFSKMYKKINKNYFKNGYFMYYYSKIKPYILRFKIKIQLYNIKKYSKNNSINIII